MKNNKITGVASVLPLDTSALQSICDEKSNDIKDVLNINEEENLITVPAFEEGIKIQPDELILNID